MPLAESPKENCINGQKAPSFTSLKTKRIESATAAVVVEEVVAVVLLVTALMVR